MLQCVIAMEQRPAKVLPARGCRHSAQLRSRPVSTTSLTVDGNVCAAKSWGGAGWSPARNSSKHMLAHEAAALPLVMAARCGSQPQDGACRRHGCFQPGGAGSFWQLMARDSRQPALLWVTPTAPVLGQPRWRLCIHRDGE